MIKKALITILFFIATLKSDCVEGCLKCDSLKKRCLLCDPSQNYKTFRGNCIKTYNKNCAISNLEGNCLECLPNYFLDIYTYSCVEIPKEGTVPNCIEYQGNNVCKRCEQSYYLDRNNGCVQINDIISNCMVYKSLSECLICENGFLLSVDYKICISPPQIDNCSTFSQFKCVSCKDGYTKNENNYIYELLGFYSKRNVRILQNRMIQDLGVNMNQRIFNSCQKLFVENCDVYANFNTCMSCKPNYFVKDGKCEKYPEESIPFCEKYASINKCTSCAKKMYLKSDLECAPIVPINFCEEYDSTANSTSCSKCISSYFLSEPNICSKRTSESQIKNCEKLFINLEKCEKCITDYIATNDNKACLPIVKNCQEYESSHVETTELVCRRCESGYYYEKNAKICVKGSVEFCEIYNINKNECEVCKNRYYLSLGYCINHEDLVYCDIFSNLLKNSCSECNGLTQKFERLNTCMSVEVIQNCDVYLTTTQCEICKDGYFLTYEKKCQIIPGEEFCLQKSSDNCIKCMKNYILQNGRCRDPLFHIIRNCDSHNLNGLNSYENLTCNYCRQNTIPVDYKDSFVCYENEYIENQLLFTPDEKCLQYKQILGTYTCVTCKNGYLIKDGSCVEECPLQNTIRTHVIQYYKSEGSSAWDNIYVDQINECGVKIPFCKVASPDLLQDFSNFTYSCVICDENSISSVSFDEKMLLIQDPNQRNEHQDFSPVSFSPSKTCINIADNTTKIIGDLSNGRTSLPFCDLYYNLDIGFGCLKCKPGYTGEIVNIINQCDLYLNVTTCRRCKAGYYLKFNYLCVKVTPVTHCIEYGKEIDDKCVRCEDEFYLDGFECKYRTNFIEYCSNYVLNNQQCETCENGFINHAVVCAKSIIQCKPNSQVLIGLNPLVVQCTQCMDGFYRYEDLCLPGGVAGCKEYALDQINRCIVCENLKYLQDNQCLNHVVMNNCDSHSTYLGKCKKCIDSHYLFSDENFCAAINNVSNCAEYSDINQCKRCNDYFYFSKVGQLCIPMPANSNCVRWGEFPNSNHCVKCELGYVLYNNTCHNWFISQMEYCQIKLEDETKSYKECKYCQYGDGVNHGVVNKDLNNLGICLETQMITYFQKNVPSLQIPENCVRYEYNSGINKINCKKCSGGFLAAKDLNDPEHIICIYLKDCIKRPNHYPTYIDIKMNNNKVNIVNGPSCLELTGANYDPNLVKLNNCFLSPLLDRTEIIYRCTRCFDNFISIINVQKNESNKEIGFFNHIFGQNFSYKPTHSAPVIDECVRAIDLKISGAVLNSLNELPGCSFYFKYYDDADNTLDRYGCLACQQGYTGHIKPNNILQSGYIDACIPQTNLTEVPFTCGTDEYPHWRSLYHPDLYSHTKEGYDLGVYFNSCQRCLNNGEVVIVKAKGSAPYNGFRGFSHGGTDPNVDPVTPAHSCVAVTPGTDIIDNCALAFDNIPNTAVPGNPGLSSGSYFCVACKPGFRPIPAESAGPVYFGIVQECVAITNCDTSSTAIDDLWLNACSKCSESGPKIYAWLYDETEERVRYDKCAETITQNCAAVTSGQECILCKKGYYKEGDKCVIYVQSKSLVNLDQVLNDKISLKNLQILFSNYSDSPGVYSCENGFVPFSNYNGLFSNPQVNLPPIPYICTKILDVTNLIDLTLSTSGISNCQTPINHQNYRFNLLKQNRLDCFVCNTNYINADDGNCVLATEFPNCSIPIGLNSNFCKVCNPGYVVIAGICFIFNPLNYSQRPVVDCEVFDKEAFVTQIICLKCKNYKMIRKTIVDAQTTYTCVDPPTPLPNCVQYNSDDVNHVYCVQCEHNYSLMILKNDSVDFGIGPVPGYNRFCMPLTGYTDINCSDYKNNELSQGILDCKTCAPGFLPQRRTSNFNKCIPFPTVADCLIYDVVKDVVILQNTPIHYNPNLSTLGCIQCQPTHYLQQIEGNNYSCVSRVNVASYTSNCDEFELYSDACKFCKVNFGLNLTNHTCDPIPGEKGSLINCGKMEECDVEKNYFGLNPHLASIVSCHQCRDSSKIPFVSVFGGVSFTGIKGIAQYGIDLLGTTFRNLNGGKSMFCAEPTQNSFGISLWSFPTNCAIGVLNIDSALDSSSSTSSVIDRTKVAVFCGACKPGYKAVYGVDVNNVPVNLVIIECQAILNCRQFHAFNYCTKCNKDYSFQYANNKVNFDSCVLTPNNPACYSYDNVRAICVLCNKGTYLNKDGYCENINPPRCEYNNFNFRTNYTLNNFPVGLFLNSEGRGCNKCLKGYTAIYKPDHYFICTESEVHAESLLGLNTQYLKNCKNYFVQNNLLRCQTCITGFVPLIDTRTCTPIGPISNCALALTPTSCRECVSGFVTVNRLCVAQNIPNCNIYLHDPTYQEQRCAECNSGYYLLANHTCGKGQVDNCLIFETQTVCNQCKENFQLVTKKNGISYCFPIDPRLNCLEFNTSQFQVGRLECSKCKNNLYVLDFNQENFFRTHCMKYSEVTNCLIYDIKPANADSSFQCLQCTNNFYLDEINNVCLLRTVKPENCTALSLNSDKCISCKEGYYLENYDECIIFPTGVPNCRIYKDASTCTGCKTNRYLSENQCLEVVLSNRLPNCLYYLAPSICEECAVGYLLIEGTCVKIEAQNCKTVESIKSCKSCKDNEGFKEEDGIRSCIATNIANCIVNEDEAPYKCVQCDSSSFVQDGICTILTEFILGCEIYDSLTTCRKCSSQRALSLDKTKCLYTGVVLENIDPFCSETQILEKPLCNTCDNGYVFKDGICSRCEIDKERCYICDPRDLTKCLLCKSGYFMNENLECKHPSEINPIPEPKPEPEPTPNPKPESEMTLILSIEAFLLLLVFF